MLVRIIEDDIGNLILQPVSEKRADKYAAHMEDMTGYAQRSAYLQNEYDITQFRSDLNGRARRELNFYGAVTVRMDPWVFGHMLGYDAHEVS